MNKTTLILIAVIIFLVWVHWKEKIKKIATNNTQAQVDIYQAQGMVHEKTYNDGTNGEAKVIMDKDIFAPYTCGGSSNYPDQLPDNMHYVDYNTQPAIIWEAGVKLYYINPCKQGEAETLINNYQNSKQ